MTNLKDKLIKKLKSLTGTKPQKRLKNNFSSSIKKHKDTIFRLSLVLVFVLAFLIRFYKIDTVLGDWHSWRQSDTAAVTWYFANQKLDILHPRFFDVSSTPSGLDNPYGFRFVEFPIYNLGHLATYKFLQLSRLSQVFNYPFEAAGRLFNIVFWLIGGWFFYRLINQIANRKTALTVVIFWLFLPYNIYYSRTILPDPLTVSLSIISLFYWFGFYDKGQNRQLILAALLTALALLAKPYAVFIIAPVVSFLFILKLKNKNWLTKGLIIGGLSLLPLLWWRWWMKSFPEGIPHNKWLFNAGGMRLKPAWWRWLFYERIAKLIAGGWLTAFILQAVNLPLSQVKLKNKKILIWLTLSLMTGSLAYLIVFARGNIQHDYYQIMIIPTLSLVFGLGLNLFIDNSLYKKTVFVNKAIPILIALLITGFGLIFSWYQIKEYYKVNDERVIHVIEKLKSKLPPESKIITDYQGNSLLLYHFKRQGWPIPTISIKDLYFKGLDYYFASVNNYRVTQLKNICSDILETDGTYLVNLSSCYGPKN